MTDNTEDRLNELYRFCYDLEEIRLSVAHGHIEAIRAEIAALRATLRQIDPQYRIERHPDRLTVTVHGKEVLIGTGYALINMTKETLMQRIERAEK